MTDEIPKEMVIPERELSENDIALVVDATYQEVERLEAERKVESSDEKAI